MEFTQDTLGGMFESAPENIQPDNQQQGDSWQQDLFSNPAPDQDYDPLMPQEQIKPVNNDEVRYQYFQSQADKMKAENEALRREMAELKGMVSTVQQPVQQQQPEVPEETFPSSKSLTIETALISLVNSFSASFKLNAKDCGYDTFI